MDENGSSYDSNTQVSVTPTIYSVLPGERSGAGMLTNRDEKWYHSKLFLLPTR